MTQCEEMLIVSVFPVMQMKPRYGAISYKGHVANLVHNLQNIADIAKHSSRSSNISFPKGSTFLKADISSANFRLSGKDEVAVEWLMTPAKYG